MNEVIRKIQLCADGLMELYSTLNETEPEAVYATLLGLHQLADETLALLKPKCAKCGGKGYVFRKGPYSDINHEPCPDCQEQPSGLVKKVRTITEELHSSSYLRDWLDKAASRIEQLEEERDLAIAHDQQPYPTAQAYEKVCNALHKARRIIERLERRAKRAEECIVALEKATRGLQKKR